jgi:hypothetical protein
LPTVARICTCACGVTHVAADCSGHKIDRVSRVVANHGVLQIHLATHNVYSRPGIVRYLRNIETISHIFTTFRSVLVSTVTVECAASSSEFLITMAACPAQRRITVEYRNSDAYWSNCRAGPATPLLVIIHPKNYS